MTSQADLQDPFGLTGTVLDGQYRADAVVGEGGFGVVYRGRHLSLDQPIAIKVLKGLDGGDAAINSLVLEKFRAEARLLYTLSQSSLQIVRALDYGASTMPSGAWAPFMILEWLSGRSLSEDLHERRKHGQRGRSLAEVYAILEPVAAGLSVAHERQVAHRDVKPANIFLLDDAPRVGGPSSQGPKAKVLDFGIAKIMKDGESAGTKGTFASFTWLYAAPEQLDPRLGQTGLATDVYGFALLMTELLTDRPPVEERDVVSIMRAAADPTRRPTPRTRGANVPDALEQICLRALAVDPRSRFGTMGELWAALSSVRGGAPTSMRAAMPPSVVVPESMLDTPVRPYAPSMLPNTTGMPSMAAGASAPAGYAPAPNRAGRAPSTLPSAPAFQVSAAMSPPPGTRPPGFGSPPIGYAPPVPYPMPGPPPGMPPHVRRLPFVRADGTSPVVVITIIGFVLALVVAGSCALVGAAATSGSDNSSE